MPVDRTAKTNCPSAFTARFCASFHRWSSASLIFICRHDTLEVEMRLSASCGQTVANLRHQAHAVVAGREVSGGTEVEVVGHRAEGVGDDEEVSKVVCLVTSVHRSCSALQIGRA